MFTWFRRVRARIRYRHFNRDLKRELDVHRAMVEEDHLSHGATADAARWQAARTLGNVTLAREASRATWIAAWLESVWQDVSYAFRTLRKRPGFTLAVIATLTLGIGLNTAFFTVFNAMALRPWPAADPDRVVLVSHQAGASERRVFTPEEVDFIRAHTASLSHLAGLGPVWPTRIRATPSGDVHDALVGVVSHGFFDVMGRPMALGRGFQPDDARHGAPRVTVISYGTWHRRFGGDPDVLGRYLYVDDDTPFAIIGVAARGVHVPPPNLHEAWVLPAVSPRVPRMASGFTLVARLAPGVDHQTAAAELTVLHGQARAAAGTGESRGVEVRSTARAGFAYGYGMVQAALVMVLLLACLNVANMQLARSLARRAEISLRMSLGAGRARVVRQLVTEASLLAGPAAIGAVIVAYTVPGIVHRYFQPDAIYQPWTPDANVLWLTGGLGLLCVLLFGLAPALQSTSVVRSSIGATGPVGGYIRTRFRTVLLGTQIAFSAVLLVGASLLTRGLAHAASSDPDFDLQDVTIARLTAPLGWTNDMASSFRMDLQAALERSSLWPVGFVTYEPLERVQFTTQVRAADRSDDAASQVVVRPMSAESFQVLHLAFTNGRAYDDRPSSTEVVVNETLARRFWPSAEAVGQTLVERDRSYTVTGVVRDVRFATFESIKPVEPVLYRPSSVRALTMTVRASPQDVRGDLHAILQAIDARVTAEVVPLSDNVNRALETEIVTARIAWGIGALGLSLATVGLFGMFGYLVEARRRDIGIRLALGASRKQVLASVFAATRWALIGGLGAGLLLSMGGGALLQSQLFGLSPLDPMAYGLALTILLAAALVATFIPARRAMRVDPAMTLRAE